MYLNATEVDIVTRKPGGAGELPSYGRFLQTDPIGYQDSPNLYAYVGNDPINFVDPLGLSAELGLGGQDHPDCTGDLCRPDAIVTGIRGLVAWIFNWELKRDITKDNNVIGDRAGAGRTTSAHINLDESCSNVAALQDPAVQQAALDLLREAIAANAEFGAFVSPRLFGGFSVGPSFTSGDQRGIQRSVVNRNQPGFWSGFWGPALSGNYPPNLFIHTHQNNPPPSPVGTADRESADQRNITYAAIDKAGNVTCAR